MTPRLTGVLFVFLAAVPCLVAQEGRAPDLTRSIDSLSAFEYTTRTNAARALRRAPAPDAVPALTQAVRTHADQFVRPRALVLLTAFNDRATPGLMRSLLDDRNDRVREIAFRWFERFPDPGLAETLLAALNTEQAEFVRPALVRAVAALPSDARVEGALTSEAGRGLDFFRSAVIEALGDYRAAYAVPAIASLAAVEGPLQDDAVLALGRIGDRRAIPALAALTDVPQEVAPALQAAQCLLGDNCEGRIAWLTEVVRSPAARPATARAAVAALGAVAADGHAAAMDALMDLGQDEAGRLRSEVGFAVSEVALRQPDDFIIWLSQTKDDGRARAVELLREGFEGLEEDFAEEQFFAVVRTAYWGASEGSTTRTLVATLIDKLEF